MKVVNVEQRERTRDAALARQREYYRTHREEYARYYAARPKHGLTPAMKRAYLDAIGWACETCGRPFTAPKDAHVDHDHRCCPGPQSCGECIRGLLCGHCNRALGMVYDDGALLFALIDYLDRYNSSTP